MMHFGVFFFYTNIHEISTTVKFTHQQLPRLFVFSVVHVVVVIILIDSHQVALALFTIEFTMQTMVAPNSETLACFFLLSSRVKRVYYHTKLVHFLFLQIRRCIRHNCWLGYGKNGATVHSLWSYNIVKLPTI